MSNSRSRFTIAAWLFLGYLVAVILFGAWVRISHSGDGCGSNWPTCHGEVLPVAPTTATLVEFTHRVTSGLCGVLGLALLVWAWCLFRRGPVTWAVALTLLFIVFEGAIGAGLVLSGLVADDASTARAVVITLHLTNTLALTATASWAAWRSSQDADVQFLARRRGSFLLGITLVVLTAASGAVTALGDTLFPRTAAIGPGLVAEIGKELSAGNHFLVRLRIVHPTLAMIAAAFLMWLLRRESRGNRWARAAMYLVAIEVGVGFINVALAAPGWLQILHLLFGQALWIALVLASAALKPSSLQATADPVMA